VSAHTPEDEASADLIAAAPDLLEAAARALEDLEFLSGETADDQPTVQMLRAAIAKATGGAA
jgi:hypothetical protein